MASILNSIKNTADDFSGVWEDVQWYPTVKIAMVSPISGELNLQWTNTKNGRVPRPDDEPLCSVDVCYNDPSGELVFEKDSRARWFRLNYTNSNYDDSESDNPFDDLSLSIMTSYKDAPTTLKIVDNDENNVVTVSAGSVYTMLVDNSGVALKSTSTQLSDDARHALFINPRQQDLSNTALGINEEGSKNSLKIAIRDSSNGPTDTCGNFSTFRTEGFGASDASNALYVRPSDASGFDQAGTITVTDACLSGVALFMTTVAGSTVDNSVGVTEVDGEDVNYYDSNALFVCHVDSSMNVYDKDHPTPCDMVGDTTNVKSFDISEGMTEYFTSHGALEKGPLSIKNLFVYNDGPTLVRLKLYDLIGSTATTEDGDNGVGGKRAEVDYDGIDLNDYIAKTIYLPPGETKEFEYPNGIKFSNGVAFRAVIDEPVGAPRNTVFVAGTYVTSNNTGLVVVEGAEPGGSKKHNRYNK